MSKDKYSFKRSRCPVDMLTEYNCNDSYAVGALESLNTMAKMFE